MLQRIALVSSDGKVINQHFGHAEVFHIFDVDEKGYSFVESRNTESCCNGQSHDVSRLERITELISDCKAAITR